ncbi:MAG TPA: acylphosphatase [Alphaproteobacteria bacterium]|nr:acylphosphatase [Alphaproteobacteria bacterium]
MNDSIAVRVEIRGRVQGVWYRGWTLDQAQRRGLRGWVRNRRDGSVEALFIGAKDQVEAMIEACREGPPAARVDAVERFSAHDGGEAGFRQLPTE